MPSERVVVPEGPNLLKGAFCELWEYQRLQTMNSPPRNTSIK